MDYNETQALRELAQRLQAELAEARSVARDLCALVDNSLDVDSYVKIINAWPADDA